MGRTLVRLLISIALLISGPVFQLARATDVDGSNDCPSMATDFGDAPEGVQAYPGVLGCFPTCLAPGPVGNQTFACPPISSVPGPAGFVKHVHPAAAGGYWLGCFATGGGYDGEPDGKVNDSGAPVSACGAIPVDCIESAFGLSFGQDECYGSNDAGLAAMVSFISCTNSTVTFTTTNCSSQPRTVYLNLLVDWNQDGDWNDNFSCAGIPGCAYEWAVKNVPVTLPGGCGSITSPPFLAGPTAGKGWMRITISDGPVSDDFPWAGVATMASQALSNGETEDYPVGITSQGSGTPCPDYQDWGDAPEGVSAYGGVVIGMFPSCGSGAPAGAPDLACAPISTAPGPLAGWVRHVANAGDPKFWFGCGDPAAGTTGIDSEPDAKVNTTGSGPSACDGVTPVDVPEPAFSGTFGQDEAYGDAAFDAGVRAPVTFHTCAQESVDVYVYNCDNLEFQVAYLNVCVDMNADGDWNDNFACPGVHACAYEWTVKNRQVSLPPGCTLMNSGAFRMGPNAGPGWMRLTLSLQPVGDDYPWNGSAGTPGGAFACGETEDYPVQIAGPDSCQVAYEDFGDAPENVAAYPSGINGNFPTCLARGAVGTQDLGCGTALSTVPGPTGYVRHVSLASDAMHFWLGCGQGSPMLAIDGETDGKVAVGAPWGGPSACDPAVATDCIESLIGLSMNQDECVGDLDAGVSTPTWFRACSTGVAEFRAWNCENQSAPAVLNVLIDWNHDGDWNDVILPQCGLTQCTPEWVVKNLAIALNPGCNKIQTPAFQTGTAPGVAWMRLTLSSGPVSDDFPWNGSAGMPGGSLSGGETEDYAVNVLPRTSDVLTGPVERGVWMGTPAPNPAAGRFVVSYSLPSQAEISIAVYDIAGRRRALLASGLTPPGVHATGWDFRDASGAPVSAGLYVIKLRAGDVTLTRSLIHVR